MKKFAGLLIAGAVILAPTAVLADTSVVISGVIAPAPSGTPDVTTTTSTTVTVAPLSAHEAKKQAEADKKEAHRAAEEAKKEAKEADKATKDLRVDDSFDPQSASWNNPSLIHNGGLKFG